MLAGSAYQEKVTAPQGRLRRLVRGGKSNGEIIREFYLAAYARFPERAELEDLERAIGTAEVREQALADFVWAVMASREMAENH
jgi:hypothetical protein